jgi:hypothetical protein
MVWCQANNWPMPVREHRFHPVRKWRFDYAWPEHLVALEQEGGVFQGGRHTSGAGFLKDAEKYNTATMMGWRIIRGTPSQVRSLFVLRYLAPLLGMPYDIAIG